ncbi:malignant fibrous histiocytoma-amplified sequence 1 homolog [Octopus vulgaris]|uniref:Malignant fibrous histiocytoma-amplified sequence 1 homolog n=1 Tax=Octopus vulgaris TaxID=6645 RepID=A0AA36B4I4_OCTVU|nr:malignant fibrous histiocytoma-amplified sequence 1 homolog [Octopus vulgaris]
MDISSNIDEVTHLRRLVETDDPSFFGFKKLRVRGRDLHELPVAIFSLVELEVLSLSPDREASLYYKLYFLPKQIGQLINLRILILDTNALTNLPPEISNLSHLEILTLSNNYLTSLPPQFHRLNELQSLHLANNSFSVFPPQICILKNLQFLDLSDNKISELPHSIVKVYGVSGGIVLCDEGIRRTHRSESTTDPEAINEIPQRLITEELAEDTFLEKISTAIEKLSNGKAPGQDGIPTEVHTHGGACDFRGIANCWTDLIKQKCGPNDCSDDIICKNKDLLAECFQVNCDNNESNYNKGTMYNEHMVTVTRSQKRWKPLL